MLYTIKHMNSLSPTRPLLLVTIGPPGSGKSFFARQFAETFNAPLVSFDEIRAGLFEEITHSTDEDLMVAHIAGLQLRELLKTKKTIIIDGGHNPKISRSELEKVARVAGYQMLSIWVQTDERTARARSFRHTQDISKQSFNRALTEAEFISQAKRFTAPSRFESFVVISGRHTYPTQARIVLKRFAKPRDAKPTTPTRNDVTPPTPGRRTLSIN